MNNAEIKPLASPLSLRDLGVFSAEGTKRVVLCALLPALLFLSHAALGYLVPSYLTSYLPILALVSLGCIAYFHTVGLVLAVSLSLVTFLSQGASSHDLWHVLQLLSLSLSWVVTYLCFAEIRLVYENLSQQLSIHKEQTAELTQTYQLNQAAWEERREALQEEIARLIEEAEQRRLESEQQNQHAMLMRSEIDLLNGQKEKVLRSEQSMQEALVLKDQKLSELRSVFEQLETQVIERQQLESEYHQGIQEQKEQCEQLSKQLLAIQKTHARQVEELKANQEVLIQEQQLALTKQLKESYEQQISQLQQAHAKQMDMSAHQNHDIPKIEEALSVKYKQQLEDLKAGYEQQLSSVKQLHAQQLEEIQKNLHQAIQVQQERCLQLEQQVEALQILQAEQVCDHSSLVHRELVKVEGLHKQLRTQFEEKSRVLDQTRRQLFKLEGELELACRERKDRCFEDASYQDSQILIQTLAVVQQELDEVELQVQDLESLVTLCLTLDAEKKGQQ